MFSSILWSSWETETCQLSTRPHLDASEQRGGRALPQQDPRPPLPLPTGLAFPSPDPQGHKSQHLVSGAFLAAHQAPFSPAGLCSPQEASGESSPRGPGVGGGERQWQVTMRGGQGGQQAIWPAPACSRLLSLHAPASPRQRQGLPTSPHGQLLNKPPRFVPRGKETKPSENVQTNVVGTLWRSGAGGGRLVLWAQRQKQK